MSSPEDQSRQDFTDTIEKRSVLLRQGRRQCRQTTAYYAKTFYFASFCLPRKTRMHSYAVYAFCRWVDNSVDDAKDTLQAVDRLNIARQALDDAYYNGNVSPGLLAFRHTVRQRGVPKELFQDLLLGMEMDLTKSRYHDWPELDLYCYRVAGVVGLMMTHLFGFDNPSCFEQAKALGTAMQLTNILRDIREDLDRGRIYLPLNDLDSFGLSQEDLTSHNCDDRFVKFMQFQIQRARDFYATAETGIPHVLGSTHRQTIRVMGHLYGLILNEIEKLNYDVFRARAHVTTTRKIQGLFRSQFRTWREDLALALD